MNIRSLLAHFFGSADSEKANEKHLITLETPRLILREHKLEDVDRIYEISKSKGFDYYCFDGTRKKAEEFIAEAIRTQKPDPSTGRRPNHMLAITIKDTGELIGHTCLESVNYIKGADYEVNFFVDPKYQNKGYGLEAIANMSDYGYKTYNLPTMTVTVHPNNGPSRYLIVKDGYKKVDDLTMKTATGTEPRELFVQKRATFYEKRSKDKYPLLMSLVGNIPAPEQKPEDPKP